MKRLGGGILAIAWLAWPLLAQADVVELANGDRLSGEVVKIEAGAVTVNTAHSGEVKIGVADVAGIEMEKPLGFLLLNGEAVQGRLHRQGEELWLDTGGPEARAITLAEIESAGVPEVAWSRLVGLSLLGSLGNTVSAALGGKAEATRTTKWNKFAIGVRGDYQERREDNGGTKSRSATVQNAFGRIRFDQQLTKRFYVGVFDDVEHDFFKDIRLRNRVGVGPGYRFLDTPAFFLSGFVGIAHTFVDFRKSPDANFATAVFSEEFRWKISDMQLVYQLLDIYPNLQNGSDWTLRAEAGFRQTVFAGLFLDLNLIDEYNHAPAPGRKTNDIRYSVSLGYLW